MTIENINDTLSKMAKMALKRREKDYWSDNEDSKRYIRINSKGYRVVSLDYENPCGALYSSSGEEITETTNIQEAREQLSKELENHELINKDKPEHRLQAFIIHTALTRPEGISLFLGCKAEFDELIFIDDEFTIENIRADMIFLGRKGNNYFPVFIELKVARFAKELQKQLENIHDYLEKYDTAFIKYLSSASGISKDKIDYSKSKQVAIWPDGGKNKRNNNELTKSKSNIIIIGYKVDGYTFNVEQYNK